MWGGLANFITIAEVNSIATARALIAALQGYGFSPMEGGEAGLPGMPGIRGGTGKIGVQVPQGEAEDAKMLAADLLKDMQD